MAAQPLVVWSDDASTDEALVWWTRLDGRYQVEVQQHGQSPAQLLVFDRERESALVLDEEVALSYGALFGPDVSDVARWQERVLRFVDEEYQGGEGR